MQYTIQEQKTVRIVYGDVDESGLRPWTAVDDEEGDKTYVVVLLENGETVDIFVDSTDPAEVQNQVEILIRSTITL